MSLGSPNRKRNTNTVLHLTENYAESRGRFKTIDSRFLVVDEATSPSALSA